MVDKLMCFERGFFDFVANALQVHNHPAHGEHQAQITGGGLAAGNNQLTLFIDFHFHAIDDTV